MLLRSVFFRKYLMCRTVITPSCRFSQDLENSYSLKEKEKILEVINDPDTNTLTRYDITKARIKHVKQYKSNNGYLKSLSDIDMVYGFSDKYAKKLFDSILEGPTREKNEEKAVQKIRGQVLHPPLSETVRQNCRKVLTVYVSVNSVCWACINKDDYEVLEWKYYGISYPDGKRFQITDIMNIAWNVTNALPHADIYVMKAEATTLRAAGSDPNNPKVLAVNLQKAQMVAMIVALINARNNEIGDLNEDNESSENDIILRHKVYFLRPTLPYRLYGTLVGNEKVSTDQIVEMILQEINERPKGNSHVYISESLRTMFRNKNDLEKDMLGHCLLLALTFMDICMYRRKESIEKLLSRK